LLFSPLGSTSPKMGKDFEIAAELTFGG